MSSKNYFDKVAPDWDNMLTGFFQVGVRKRAIKEANIKANAVVADIGAGSGFISEGLLGLNVKIIAVDQSENMLEVMKNKFFNANNIEYRLGEAENLPIKDNEVDCAFANMFLHHVESPLKTIKEIYRILKPGGQLIITDLDKHEHEFLKTEQNDKWMGFDRTDIKNWFLSSGFQEVFIDCIGENCCSKSEDSKESAEISVFIAKGVKPID